MATKFSALLKQIIGFIVQVTEVKEFIPVPRYDLLCDGM